MLRSHVPQTTRGATQEIESATMTANKLPSRRFAIFLPALSGGGAERAMVNLARGLNKRGLEIDLVLGTAIGPYLPSVPSNIRIVELGTNRWLPKTLGLARYLRSARPTAMISSLDNINIASIAKMLARVDTRVIVNVQNHVTTDLASYHGFRARLKPYLLRMFYPWADHVIAVSHGVADDLITNWGVPRELVGVIHNPVMNENIDDMTREPVDHPFFAPGEPPVLIGVGRLTLQKDFPNLFRAFARVRAKRSVRLLILGDGELREPLEALARQLGIDRDLSMPGFAANPYAYMAKSRIFVLSSLWEGLPTVVMEALATGTPVVSTDCPSGPREILDDGAFGKLVPMSDDAALAAAIERELDEQPDPARLRARAMHYSAERSLDKYSAILDPSIVVAPAARQMEVSTT
jgi:glycosyltransferase involved in cell wall biosynthesis